MGPNPKDSDCSYGWRCTSCKNDDLGDSHVADSDGDDCDEGDEEGVDHGDDDNIFEDNQPLLKCPETKEVLREKKSKSDH